MYTVEDVKQDRPELWKEYRGLYKDVYGRQPLDMIWGSLTEFKEDLQELRDIMDEPETEEAEHDPDDIIADDGYELFGEGLGWRQPIRYDDDSEW